MKSLAVTNLTTGAELTAAIRARAAELGPPVARFAAPLSPDPDKWLYQTARAMAPKPHTIARVQALLAGAPVPPPPPNNFQKCARRADPVLRVRVGPAITSWPDPVTRDPCFRCGTRADIGCRHQAPQP